MVGNQEEISVGNQMHLSVSDSGDRDPLNIAENIKVRTDEQLGREKYYYES